VTNAEFAHYPNLIDGAGNQLTRGYGFQGQSRWAGLPAGAQRQRCRLQYPAATPFGICIRLIPWRFGTAVGHSEGSTGNASFELQLGRVTTVKAVAATSPVLLPNRAVNSKVIGIYNESLFTLSGWNEAVTTGPATRHGPIYFSELQVATAQGGGRGGFNVYEFQIIQDAGPNYAQWASLRLTGSPATAQTDDPDGDGMVNFCEYAFGTDPLVAVGLPMAGLPVLVDGKFIYDYLLPKPLPPGVRYFIQTSSSLDEGSWTLESSFGHDWIQQWTDQASVSPTTLRVRVELGLGFSASRFTRLRAEPALWGASLSFWGPG
jgi:hypothetical protein